MFTRFHEIETIISAIRGRPKGINSFDAQSHFDHFAPVNDQAAYIIDFKRKQICEQKGVYDLLGYSAEEFQYKTLIGILHPDDRNLICHIV